jgi:hypothetical protein
MKIKCILENSEMRYGIKKNKKYNVYDVVYESANGIREINFLIYGDNGWKVVPSIYFVSA